MVVQVLQMGLALIGTHEGLIISKREGGTNNIRIETQFKHFQREALVRKGVSIQGFPFAIKLHLI